jgi:transcription termination factor Rho
MTDTFERTQLDGKDRGQLSEIAAALGVKAVSRMRKAELVDAIVSATSGASDTKSNVRDSSGQDSARPRKVRSTTSGGDDLASLADEQNALASITDPVDDMALIRRRPPSSADNGGSTSSTSTSSTSTSSTPASSGTSASARSETSSDPASTASADRASVSSESGSSESGSSESGFSESGTATDASHQPARDDDGQGNRRRRRRRGRDRDRPGGVPNGGSVSSVTGERSESSREDFTGDLIDLEGLLDLREEGYGFLRTSGYLAGRNDAYVSASQVRRFGLRKGDYVKGAIRPPASTEKYPALVRVDLINGMTPEEARSRVRFEDLTPLFPDSKLRLELDSDPTEITGRIIDLIAPIGKGQRGLIVSPPKAGKTTIIKQIVYSIERNSPETHVMVLLVDERPEEVTDMRRHVLRAEVVASTFDRPSDEHCHVAELAIERARRLVEMGKDVVIILDGITRLARAYNLAAPASGRIMSGGVDSSALYPPKKFFGSARNVEEGGSLTILATALIDTGSKMDEVIFEEFKGTGNMELRLDRRVADRRIYPAIDVEQSSTRHEELLFDRNDLQQIWKLRRVLNALVGGAGLELLIDKLRHTKTNAQFLAEIAKAPAGIA